MNRAKPEIHEGEHLEEDGAGFIVTASKGERQYTAYLPLFDGSLKNLGSFRTWWEAHKALWWSSMLNVFIEGRKLGVTPFEEGKS